MLTITLEDTYVLYFDGTSGWQISPDRPLAALDEDGLKFACNYLVGILLNLWLTDRDPNRVITSPEANIIVVASKGDPSQKTEITLDRATFLPMRETAISFSDPSHPVSRETRLEQWRPVDGVKSPHLISKFQGDAKLAEITVEQIKLNRGLKLADLVVKPRDQKPVISGP